MAENKKVQIKNTGGDALYPRTAAESIVNVPGGTMNVFMYLNGYGNENQFPDPYKGDRYFDIAAHKVYECVTDTTWTGKKEITSWDSNTLFFWNGEVWKYTDSEEGPLAPVLCASVDPSVTNGVSLNGGNGSPLKAIASSATANAFGTVKTDATVTNGASLVNTNGSIKAIVSSATATQLGTVKVATATENGVALKISGGAVSATQTFATNAEASAGSIASKGVTPAAMKYANTWTAIQDKGTSAAVTLAPGGVFKVAPSGATVTLSAGTVSAGMYGADAHLEMYLGSNTVTKAIDPLVLVDPLTPNAGNNCVVKYRGGNAFLYKEGIEAGYIVTNSATAATTSGSIPYGIANSQGWIVVPTGSHYIGKSSGTLKKDTTILCLDSDPTSYTRIDGSFNLTSGGLNFINGDYVGAWVSAGSKPVHLAGSIGYAGINQNANGWVYVADGTSIGGGSIYGDNVFVSGGSQCVLNGVNFDRVKVSDTDMFYRPQMDGCTFTSCTAEDVACFVNGGDVRDGWMRDCSNIGPIGLMNGAHVSNFVFSNCKVGFDAAIVDGGVIDGCQFLYNGNTTTGTGSGSVIRGSSYVMCRDCVVSGNSNAEAYILIGSSGTLSNCTITGNVSGFIEFAGKTCDPNGDYGDWMYDRSQVVAGCTIRGNDKSRGFDMIVHDAAVVFTECDFDNVIRCTTETTQSGACITFKGSNHFTGNIDSANYFAYPEHVYIESGAIVDVSGETPGVISAYKTSGRIEVGTFGQDRMFHPGGTATVIFGEDNHVTLYGGSKYRCISGGSAT